MAPSDELTLAAERLEALDAAATPGPWWVDDEGIVQAQNGRYSTTVADTWSDPDGNAALIAAMRGVAKPLAAWLRGEAAFVKWGDHDGRLALTLAREVIRATGGTDG